MEEIDEHPVFIGKGGVFVGEIIHNSVIITLSIHFLKNRIKFCFCEKRAQMGA